MCAPDVKAESEPVLRRSSYEGIERRLANFAARAFSASGGSDARFNISESIKYSTSFPL